jgi:hypothetical protein
MLTHCTTRYPFNATAMHIRDNLQVTLNGKALLSFVFTWRLLSCFAVAALIGWMAGVRVCGERRKECTEDMVAGINGWNMDGVTEG